MDFNVNSIEMYSTVYLYILFRLNGKTLFVNTSNETQEQAKLIKPGSVITVKHSGVNVQLARFE